MTRRTAATTNGPVSAEVTEDAKKMVIPLALIKVTKSYWVYGLNLGENKGFIGKMYIPVIEGREAPQEVQATFDLG